jgi:hypothetical protein
MRRIVLIPYLSPGYRPGMCWGGTGAGEHNTHYYSCTGAAEQRPKRPFKRPLLVH